MTGSVKGNLGSDSFATRLRAAMEQRRIGVGRLAAESGVSSRLIAKYRKGEVAPRDYFGDPTDNARRLAEALGLEVVDLCPSADHSPDPPKAEAA